MARKIPATVITGFLGAGKTSLIRRLIEQANGRRLGFIINEFGDLGIDRSLIEGCGLEACDADAIKELANGCICCTVADDFLPTMEALLDRPEPPEHIIIETSGLALPKPLVQAFNWPTIRNSFTVDAVVTVVDGPAAASGQFAENPQAVDAQRRADPNLDHESPLHELFADQLSSADLVIVNKADLVADARFAEVEAAIREEIPPQVKIVRATRGELDLAMLLGLESASEETIHLRHDHHGSADDGDHDHHHDDFDSVVVSGDAGSREATIAALQRVVETHTIYRAKGFAALPEAPMRLVIQGVGRRFDSYFDRRWQDGETRASRFVLIGEDLDAAELQRAFDAACAAQTQQA